MFNHGNAITKCWFQLTLVDSMQMQSSQWNGQLLDFLLLHNKCYSLMGQFCLFELNSSCCSKTVGAIFSLVCKGRASSRSSCGFPTEKKKREFSFLSEAPLLLLLPSWRERIRRDSPHVRKEGDGKTNSK